MALTKEDLQAIAALLQPIMEDVHSLKEDVQTLKGEIQTVKENIQTLNQETSRIEIILETEVKRSINLLAEGYLPMAEKIDKVQDTVEETNLTVEIIEKVVNKHSYDINKLKLIQ